MQKYLEKNGKNVFLWYIAFCIVVFQQFKFIGDLRDALNQKKQHCFHFSLKAILLHFFKNRIFWKINTNFIKSS